MKNFVASWVRGLKDEDAPLSGFEGVLLPLGSALN